MKTFRARGRFTHYALGMMVVVILAVVGGAATEGVTFEVKPNEQAIVLQFGEIKRLVHPGVHRRIPLIQDVYYCDMRPRRLELTTVEAPMPDLAGVGVDASVSYAIVDCVRFLRSARSPTGLRSFLSRRLNASLQETIGRHSSPDLPNNQNEIMTDVTARMNAVAPSVGVVLTDLNLSFSKSG